MCTSHAPFGASRLSDLRPLPATREFRV